MAFTQNDDLNIIQASDSATVSAGAGNDTYIVSPATIGAGQQVTITDTEGTNTLQLVGGLSITSSQVANDALLLTLSNGAVVTLLSASAFNFNVGGNVLAGIAGTDKDYATFAQEDLGVTVPAEGEAAVDGGAATIGGETPTTPTEDQTFTLTTGIDNLEGGAGDDTFNASVTATSAVLGGLDVVDGGDGTDTLNIADTAVAAGAQFSLPSGFTVQNTEAISVATNGGVLMDVSTIAGLESITTQGAGTANTSVTAANTTDVTTTVAGAATTTVTGGKVVSATGGTGTTTVTGKALESVTVVKGGAVTIDNLENTVAATTAKGTTLTSVTLDRVDAASAIKGEGLTDVTIKGATAGSNTVTITNAKANHSLTVNVDGTGYDTTGTAQTTTVVDAVATAVTVNATGSKSDVALTGSTAAKTVNITGDADLTLAPLASATKLDGSAATGNLTLGDLAAGTVTVSTGAGDDSFAVQAIAKTTVDSGAGNDSVTLKSAVAAGSTINLGAGDDKLLVNGGSVAASTATATTTIDAGEGTDTVAAALVNAANAAQFQNFEGLDLSSAAILDVELMTGSTISTLTLSGGAGGATVSNVAAGVGLTVSGSNTGVTTIGVKDATKATSTADSFTTTIDGTAASTATEALPTPVAAGTVVTDGVEALNIVSGGTGFVTNTMAVTDNALQTLTITGDKALALTFVGPNGTAVTGATDTVNGVSLIDASAATGVINVNTTGVTNVANAGLTVKTGSAKDVITLAQKATVDAGAGDDTITSAAAGGTFTGGAGNDTFDVTLAVATGITEATYNLAVIADAAAGDKIDFATGASGTFNATKVALDATVTTLDAAAKLAGDANAANETSWFQYGANTYIVSDTDGSTGFSAGDTVVELTGLVDLSNATLAATVLTLA
jgi:S-layer protein